MSSAPIVIIGAGLAGVTLARELRKLDAEVPLQLITADDGHFYSKPMLSNGLAAGKSAATLVMTPRDTLAAQLKADILAQTRVEGIDLATQQLRTSAGPLPYRALVLALGAQPIRLPIEGDGAADVLSINHLDHYASYRQRLDGAKRVALLGAGLIGCEFANDLRSAGSQVEVVDVFDIAPQPLGRLLPGNAGAAFRVGLESAGVRFHFGAGVQRIERTASGYRLTDSLGGITETDLVISAVGLRPETELATATGLKVNRGIVTDRQLATSAPNVYALGDCVEADGQVLPFVMPIMHQARALAKTLTGSPTEFTYPAMPVVVKTPACPAVVCPPAPGRIGVWAEQAIGSDSVISLFENMHGELHGFALIGPAAVKEKQALTARMAAG